MENARLIINRKLIYRPELDDGALYGRYVDRDELYGKNVVSSKIYGEGIRREVLYCPDRDTYEDPA